MSKENNQEVSGVPKSPESGVLVNVYATPFWDDLQDAANYLEVHYTNVVGGYLTLGVKMVGFNELENMSLRDNAGLEEKLSFMDEQFKPEKPHLELAKPHREIQLNFQENNREMLLRGAIDMGVDLEELGGRFIRMGIYVSYQIREDVMRLMYINNGKRDEYAIPMNKSNKYASILKKFWENQQ